MKRSLVVLVLCCTLAACGTPLEKLAYRTVVASKAFLDSVKSKHPECIPPNMSGVCVDLRKATAAKDLLIDAGEAYCNVATFGNDDTTPCTPAASGTSAGQRATQALQQALANYEQAEKDLKQVIQ